MSLGNQIGIIALILLAVTTGGYWYAADPAGGNDADAATGPQRDPATVDVALVEQSKLARRVEAVGTTLARQSIDIQAAAAGRVVAIDFVPGRFIEAGSTLVRLDDAAEQADVAEAKADLRAARIAFDRARQLGSSNTIAQASVDEQEAAFDAAQARLQRAEKQLRDRTIKASFSGRTGLMQVNVGARVDQSTVITTLDDLAEIEIDFSVPEVFFGAIRAGQQVKATSAAFGDRVFKGLIDTVDSRIDRVSRAFKVRARIPNPDLALPAGMFVAVDLTLQEREALTVPEEAVLAAGGDNIVFVVTDKKAERRPVALGQRDFGVVEIVDGLEVGEQVVIKGLQRVRDGGAVTISNDTNDDVPAPAPVASEPSA